MEIVFYRRDGIAVMMHLTYCQKNPLINSTSIVIFLQYPGCHIVTTVFQTEKEEKLFCTTGYSTFSESLCGKYNSVKKQLTNIESNTTAKRLIYIYFIATNNVIYSNVGRLLILHASPTMQGTIDWTFVMQKLATCNL